MSDFMIEKLGEGGLYAVFHQDGGQGFFFLYRPEANEILVQAQVHEREQNPPLREDEVQISWPTATDAYLAVRGKKVCMINVISMTAECGFKNDEDTEQLRKADDMFATFRIKFEEARQRYWKEKADK